MSQHELTTRRAALGALASIPALAPPTAAQAEAKAAATSDAALFALITAARDLDARGREAYDTALEAMRRTEKVPPPEALIVTEEDTRLWKLNKKVGDLFDESHLNAMGDRQTHRHRSEYLRSFSSILADAPYVATLDEKDRATIQLLAAGEAREDQLVAAHDQWKAARHEAEVRSGAIDAWNRSDDLLAEEEKLKARIARTPAQTVAGMMAKLALVAPCCEGIEPEDKGSSEDLLFSVAHDFNTLKPALAAV